MRYRSSRGTNRKSVRRFDALVAVWALHTRQRLTGPRRLTVPNVPTCGAAASVWHWLGVLCRFEVGEGEYLGQVERIRCVAGDTVEVHDTHSPSLRLHDSSDREQHGDRIRI